MAAQGKNGPKMNRLWAPWRMAYIKDIDKADTGCIFCAKPGEKRDRDNLILHRGTHNFVVMNLYPYNNGHLMVVPNAHENDILRLSEQTSLELWNLLGWCKRILTDAIHPEAFNIGMNIGRVAGAGIDQHIHMHIVPRWNGDTNFMPVVGETKVISQAIWETYDMLKPFFDRELGPTTIGGK